MKESNSDRSHQANDSRLGSLWITSFPECPRYRASYSAKTASRRGTFYENFSVTDSDKRWLYSQAM